MKNKPKPISAATFAAGALYATKIRAESAPRTVQVQMRGEATITAAKGEGKGPPRFEALAYSGQSMWPRTDPPLKHPVVVDLSGMDLKRQRIPALRDHDSKSIVGHTETLESDGSELAVAGVLSGAGPAAVEVIATAQNGFTWGISIGAQLNKLQLLDKGKTEKVNGRDVTGPAYIARASRLSEISFLAIPADDDAAVTSIAAEAAQGEAMSFQDWLTANGFQPESELSNAQKHILRAEHVASKANSPLDAGVKAHLQAMLDSADEDEPAPKGKKQHKKVAAIHAAAAAANDDDEPEPDPHAELRAEVADIRREREIIRLCAAHPDVAEMAIKNKWGDDTIKLKIEATELRKALPQSMQIRTGRAKDAPADGIVLEAAAAMTGRLADIDKKFDEKVLHEASTRFPKGIGLQEMIMQAAYANGYSGAGIRQDLRGVLEAAYSLQAAQFSTISLPGIFANTANKFLLDGFMFVDDSWRSIAATGSASDFKTRTSYRLTGTGVFEEVAADGEIKHGILGEESFVNRVRTYAKMFGITRQDIINDDLDAITAIARRLGRMAKLGFNRAFWDIFIANTAFFVDPSENYLKGATTNLSAVGLGLALKKFRAKTEGGEILGATPKILLVPPALEVTALELMRSTNFNSGGAATDAQIPSANIWANRFTLVVSDYLTSATEWYLLADPRDIATIVVDFLNGRQEPTVESADADFNTLGVLIRGYWDWGAALADARGGLKVKGAA